VGGARARQRAGCVGPRGTGLRAPVSGEERTQALAHLKLAPSAHYCQRKRKHEPPARPAKQAIIVMASQKNLPTAATIISYFDPESVGNLGLITIPCIVFYIMQVGPGERDLATGKWRQPSWHGTGHCERRGRAARVLLCAQTPVRKAVPLRPRHSTPSFPFPKVFDAGHSTHPADVCPFQKCCSIAH
jgi:hypothetical protein